VEAAVTYLTERQRDVLDFIADRVDAVGVAPTLREIAERFGFSSTASAQKHVLHLERKGFLVREKHQKRGLALTSLGRRQVMPEVDGVPLLGAVAAGSPIESLPQDERIELPPTMLGSGDHYALKVRGESMIDDGIHDGDVVVIKGTSEASNGDMVVALVSGEVTLKRFYRHGSDRIRLQPSNPNVPPLIVSAADVTIQGRVVGLLRRY
jgi:repressor LexA